MPAMTHVRSSHIDSVGYEAGELHVRFQTGVTVIYGNAEEPVSEDVANAVMYGESVGQALNQLIKSQGVPHRPGY